MIILRPTEAQEFMKAKYTKRWKGKDGKWHYDYGKEGRSSQRKVKKEEKKQQRESEVSDYFKGLTSSQKAFANSLPTGTKRLLLLAGSQERTSGYHDSLVRFARQMEKHKDVKAYYGEGGDVYGNYVTPLGKFSMSLGSSGYNGVLFAGDFKVKGLIRVPSASNPK